MLTIRGLVRMRKILDIKQEVIAEEMSTTRPTISNIELGKVEDGMSTRFYRLTVLRMSKDIDKEIKEDLICDLENIIKYLKTGEA